MDKVAASWLDAACTSLTEAFSALHEAARATDDPLLASILLDLADHVQDVEFKTWVIDDPKTFGDS